MPTSLTCLAIARACYALGSAAIYPLYMLVIPAYAGIQAGPGDWIPAGAGMTFHVAVEPSYAAANPARVRS